MKTMTQINYPASPEEILSENPPCATTRKLKWWEIDSLERQGCSCPDWSLISIADDACLKQIRNVHFEGKVEIGADVVIRNVPGGISNCRIRDGVKIENVARIEFQQEAPCGVGITIATLDETGSRPIVAYPGISSQIATLMTRVPSWIEHDISPYLQDFLDSKASPHEIGEGAIVRDCGVLLNVSVWPRVRIEGARSLVNGSVVNNAAPGRELAYIGSGVDAKNFILEDGKIDSGCIIRNCYVGQGVELEKGFTAHDSAFFANCSFENGEACAVLAGPYSVSMHKASLIIGCQISFMNAGSATNESNHMYKLGPVHWGVLERGVKTSSGAYIMLGAKIGAFSLVMGQHKTHPDSSAFPFSYLFGDERGATVVVPAAMLRSCGLMRDEQKWPNRDRRLKRKLPLHDRINFNVLNPFTVDSMLSAIDTISELLNEPVFDDLYIRHKGMKFTRAALERAKYLYTLAIYKYFSLTLGDKPFPPASDKKAGSWVDLGGQIIPRSRLEEILAKDDINEAEELLNEAAANYDELQMEWIGNRFGDWWHSHHQDIPSGARQFDELVAEDRQEYIDAIARETRMLNL